MAAEKFSISNSAVGFQCSGGNVHIGGSVTVNSSNVYNENDKLFKQFPLPQCISTFYGRQEELSKLDSLFFDQHKTKIVICGLGGFGKTELSKQFAQFCLENDRVAEVAWIKAETKTGLEDSYKTLKEIYKKCDKKCLIIFDNGVCRRDIVDYEPKKNNNLFLLITSKEKDWGDDVTPLQLGKLSHESSLEVLESILSNNYQEANQDLYLQLANVVDNVPLGLQIIGGYIRHQINILGPNFNIENYLQKIQKSQEDIIKKSIPRSNPNSYEKSIYAAIEVSLNKIKEEEDINVRELALNVLYVCAYLDPDRIESDELLEISAIKDKISIDDQVETQLQISIALLKNFSFINGDNCFKIHRLTQQFLIYYLNEYDQHSKLFESCLCYLVYSKNMYYVDDDSNGDSDNSNYDDDDYVCADDDNYDKSDDEFDYYTESDDDDDDYDYFDGLRFYNRKYVLSHADNNSDIVYNVYIKANRSYIFEHHSMLTVKNVMLKMLVQYGCIKCIETILKNDANVKNRIDTYKLLRLSVKHNQANVFRLLFEYLGVDNFVKNNYKETLLYAAAFGHHYDMLEMLIVDYGLDVNVKDAKGYTPLDGLFDTMRPLPGTASCYSNPNIQGYLRSCRFVRLNFLDLDRIMPTLKLFIKYGAFIQYLIKDTGTALLMYIIEHNELEVLKWLLENGIDANYTFEFKYDVTILHEAADKGNLKAMEMLISFGADIYKPDAFGNTALFNFVEKGYSNDMDIKTVHAILNLLKCENYKNTTNSLGSRLLDYAFRSNHKNLMTLISHKYKPRTYPRLKYPGVNFII